MTTSEIFERIVRHNVVQYSKEEEDSICLTDDFRESINEIRNQLDSYDKSEKIEEFKDLTGSESYSRVFTELTDESDVFCPAFVSLMKKGVGFSVQESVIISLIIDRLNNPVSLDGVPKPFIPIRGNLIEILELFEHSVLYIWRHDCEPCESLKETLENTFETGTHKDVALFAICGQNCPRLLKNKYQAKAAPLTLFLENGRVDSRLYGSFSSGVYLEEIATLTGSHSDRTFSIESPEGG